MTGRDPREPHGPADARSDGDGAEPRERGREHSHGGPDGAVPISDRPAAAPGRTGDERAAGAQRARGRSADPSGLAEVDTVIAVASAKGGVGKTTVATHLACALAGDGLDVGLFDADVYGPNAPSVLAVEGPVYTNDDGDPTPVDVTGDRDAGLSVVSVGLVAEGAPLAWRGSMAHEAVAELFEETAWGDRDALVVDLPPGTGDVVLTTLQEVPVDGVVFVTTPFHAAVTDTARSLDLFRDGDVPVVGAVVNMAGFTCPTCGDDHALFDHGGDGDAGDDAPLIDLDAPVLAELDFDPSLQATPRPDDLPDAFRSLGETVERRIEEIWTVDPPDDAVDLRGVPADERHALVENRFDARDSGDRLAVVSDRDPSPVREFLASLAGVDPAEVRPFDVRRETPESWVLETERP